MTDTNDAVSRRTLLESVSVAAVAGVAGCSSMLGGEDATSTPTGTAARNDTTTAAPTPTPTETPTETATRTPDRPNIRRQTVLRDSAAITHIRRTVTGTVSWPSFETYNLIDSDLLGRWEGDENAFDFHDDLRFSHVTSDSKFQGTYGTWPQEGYLYLQYEDGDEFEYFYEFETEGGDVVIDLYDSDGEYITTLTQTEDRDDTRSVKEIFEHVVVYKPDGAETESQDLETGAAGSGFIVSPDGHVVTNAHVVGTHTDPRETLYNRLARQDRRAIRNNVEENYDLSESETEAATDILLDELFDYYAEHAEMTAVSTDVGILYGTAGPNEPFEAKSWPARIETTGSVYEEVSGELTWGRDVAVLKVDAQEPLPTVRLGSANDLGTGEDVFVIGYPDIGVDTLFEDRNTTLEPTLTSGVVSARRTLKSGVTAIQTDAGINHGNSGGPMYNGDGEVVGIATFKPVDLELEEIAFALPIETAKGFLGELGVENEPGPLTTTYVEGLNAYWRGDCETVTEKMESVLEMWPDHPYAQDFIEDC